LLRETGLCIRHDRPVAVEPAQDREGAELENRNQRHVREFSPGGCKCIQNRTSAREQRMKKSLHRRHPSGRHHEPNEANGRKQTGNTRVEDGGRSGWDALPEFRASPAGHDTGLLLESLVSYIRHEPNRWSSGIDLLESTVLERQFRSAPLSATSDYWPADFGLPVPESNSSAIQCRKAVMFAGRPRKFFTKSFADIDPPGSSTTRRYFIGASPASRF
jgi:hypothetical protein